MAFVDHPSIGNVEGNSVNGVAQFLGIRYASLKDRFSEAQLVDYNGAGLDATNHGPQVLSPPSGVDLEFQFIQQTLPKPDFPGVSDLEGLNLTITVPTNSDGVVDPNAKLPVLVFIHGGGFAIGGNWWPQYDCAKIVQLSKEIRKPIIAVGINYRLGAPGFLTSPELREQGYKPNNGIRDQWTALKWIRNYISGFGGDPENVTVSGESAGGVSAGYLFLSEEPLARRIISFGGLPPLLGQAPLAFADSNAEKVKAILGLEGKQGSELVSDLLEISFEDMLQKLPPSLPWMPVLDGDIMPEPVSLSTLTSWDPKFFPGTRFIESVMIGDSKFDASIMAYSGLAQRKATVASEFREVATKTLSAHPDALASFLEHYSLSKSLSALLSDDEALDKVIKVLSDLMFFMPVIAWADGFPNDAFVFGFNEPNPWDGLFKGRSSHILDVAFLFQNYNAQLNESQRATAVALATDVITFVSGENPWTPYKAGEHHGAAFYSKGGRVYDSPPRPEVSERDTFILSLGRTPGGPSSQDLMNVAINFLSG